MKNKLLLLFIIILVALSMLYITTSMTHWPLDDELQCANDPTLPECELMFLSPEIGIQ